MTTDNNNTTATTPVETTTETTPPVTETTPVSRVIGSIQLGVDTSQIKFKSVLEMRREFGENWM